MGGKHEIPQRDHDFLLWAQNFSGKISAEGARLEISPAEAADLAASLADYAAKLSAATNPMTRTTPAVTDKNLAKKVLTGKCRLLGRKIKAVAGIDATALLNLGLHARDSSATPVGAPSTSPLLLVSPWGKLRLVDSLACGRRARPQHVIGAILFTRMGDAAPATIEDATYAGLATRHTHALKVPPGSSGKKLWVMAQWITARGLHGPLSAPVSTTLAA